MANEVTLNLKVAIDGKEKVVAITTDVKELSKHLDVAKTSADKTRDAFVKYSSIGGSFQYAIDALQQLSGALDNVFANSIKFSDSMKAANTMAGKSGAEYEKLKQQVSSLSLNIGKTRDELANGLYMVISNGVPEDNWISFLEQSAKASVGGLADLGQTVTVTSTLIKNYGASWEDVGKIQDMIQLTAKNGVTSFEQLSQALPRVAGNAATLGVPIEELMATFATLTGVSGNTAEVSTQLAAVFTALVKPTSEATEMAKAMGIEFNAAAIKGAGGMQNFLTQLDASVKAYSASSGMLEQEVYGRLFGSAESLRALMPLTGELADKFGENAAAMKDSAGTIEGAFNEMNVSSESVAKKMQNLFGNLTDAIAPFYQAAQPFVEMIAPVGMATIAIAQLGTTLKMLGGGWVSAKVKMLAFNTAALFTSKGLAKVAQATRIMAVAMKTGTHATTAFKIALKGLMAATGIGLAIAAITSVIEYFVTAGDKAADMADKLGDKTETLAEKMKAAEQSTAEARGQIELDIQRVKTFVGTRKEELRLVKELNSTYGDQMGYFKDLDGWYRALTENAEAYCKILVKQAQLQALATEVASKQSQIDSINRKREGLSRENVKSYIDVNNPHSMFLYRQIDYNQLRSHEMDMTRDRTPKYEWVEVPNSSPWALAAENIDQLTAELEEGKAQMVALMKENIEFKVTGLNYDPYANTTPLGGNKGDGAKTWLPNTFGSISTKGLNVPKLDVPLKMDINPALLSLNELEEKIKELRDKQGNAQGVDIYLNLQNDIDALEKIKASIIGIAQLPEITAVNDELSKLTGEALKIKLDVIGKEKLDEMIASLKLMLDNPALGLETKRAITETLKPLEQYSADMQNASDKEQKATTDAEKFRAQTTAASQAVGSMGSLLSTTATMTDEGTAAWLNYAGNVLSAISQMIPALVAVANAGAIAQSQTVPYPFNIIALATSVASVVAAVAAIPKFADGGIAFGPTLGLFGEYAGASHNPEVVAPLDRLRSMISPAGGIGGDVEFRIKGRELVGVLAKESNLAKRT